MATKVYIVYYSIYGHVEQLTEEIKKGVASVAGVEVKLWQVSETLSDEILAKMSAPLKGNAPVIAPDDLVTADGFIFGFTTRLTTITRLAHYGMIFVPIGYTFEAEIFEMEKIKGGSPYGVGTIASDGSKQPTNIELKQALHQRKYIAIIIKKLKAGSI